MVRDSTAKNKLINAAIALIREQGFAATSVDELCAHAGVTKGAFFHHFASKNELAVAAADHWSRATGELFAAAPYHRHKDPLKRVLSYLDFRKALLKGRVPEFTCLVGTMVQEIYDTDPDIRAACDASISNHAATLAADIAEAFHKYNVKGISAAGLALHTQAVLQGAFILAKAKGGAPQAAIEVAADSIDHLRRYIELLFQPQQRKGMAA